MGGLDFINVASVSLSNVYVSDHGRNGLSFTNVPTISINGITSLNNGNSESTGWAGLALYGAVSNFTLAGTNMISNVPIGVLSETNTVFPSSGTITIANANAPVYAPLSMSSDTFANGITGLSYKVVVSATHAVYYETDADALVAALLLYSIPGNTFNYVVYNLDNGNLLVGPGMKIQAAIDAALDGDTIEVAPGTYTEAIDVTVPNLTIRSTGGRDVTIIEQPDYQNEHAGFAIYSNLGTIRIEGFTVNNFRNGITQGLGEYDGTVCHIYNNKIIPEDGYYLRNGIQVSGVGTGANYRSEVVGNYIQGAPLTDKWASTGIQVVNAKNVYVAGNTVTTNNDATKAIYGVNILNSNADVVSNITVENNIITAKSGIGLTGLTADKLIENVAISGNTLTGQTTWDGNGINVQKVTLGDNISIENNTISGNYIGIRISDSAILNGVFEVHNDNTISGGAYGICNSGTLNATGFFKVYDNNTISGNTTAGIYIGGLATLNGGFEVYDNNTISGNYIGIRIATGATLNGGFEVHNNKLASNTFGAYNYTSIPIDATENWWGHASGPVHNALNPQGLGDRVGNYILFDPWYGTETMQDGDLESNMPVENVSTNTYYDTIQDAVDAAVEEDEIEVAPDTYTGNVVIDKKLVLRASGSRNPVILDGGGSGSVVTITANEAEVIGFTIQNSGSTSSDAGIMIYAAHNCIVSGNIVINNANGIGVVLGTGNTLYSNTVYDNDHYGIALVAGSGNTINENNIYNNGLDAIAFDNASNMGGDITNGSTGNYIKTNTISSNRDGIFLGENCDSNLITDINYITATSCGINVWRPSEQIITDNIISNCNTGIRLLGSSNNVITGNSISVNDIGIKFDPSWQSSVWYQCENNLIKNNKIFSNNSYGVWANDVQQTGDITAEENWWGDPAGPAQPGGRTGNAISTHVDCDPWWIDEGMTTLSSEVVVSLSTTETLIKDQEELTYTVKIQKIANMRGFTVRIVADKADFEAPTSFALGGDFPAIFFLDTDDYETTVTQWIYDVTASVLSNTFIDLEEDILFTFTMKSAVDADNLEGSDINLPIAEVVFRDQMNHSIPCAGASGVSVIIDSGEPEMIHENVADLPSGTLLSVATDGSGVLVRPTLELSFSDNHDLDYTRYLIQSEEADAPTAVNAFSDVLAAVDGESGYTDWQLPESIDSLEDGVYTVYFLVVDDAANFSIYDWDFEIDKSAPVAIEWAEGSLACRTTPDTNNSIDMNWTNPAGVVKNHIWYLDYSSLSGAAAYPDYNPAAFEVPDIPDTPDAYNAAAQSGWTQLAVTENAVETYTHSGMPRGYYYYYIFAEDAAGNISPASELRESISYWPGDVNLYEGEEAGDGIVNSDDIVRLSLAWGMRSTNPGFMTDIDVGPTVDYGRRSRPVPDGRINIEDLMIFSMNYDNTDYEAYNRMQKHDKTKPLKIDMQSICQGDLMHVELYLNDNEGALKGLNIPIQFGKSVVFEDLIPGTIWPDASMIMYNLEDGVVELSASTLGTAELNELNGLIATLNFRITGDTTEMQILSMIARDIHNNELGIINDPITDPTGNQDQVNIPVANYLSSNFPNPFNPTTTIKFGLNKAQDVKITIFNARGQVVSTLVNGIMPAGIHNVVWNGQDSYHQSVASGVYFYRMETKEYTKIKKAILMK